MKLFKRRYKSKNQQVALAGFTFGMVFLGIVMLIVLSAQTSDSYLDRASNKDILLSEAVIRFSH
ncbi:MAG: hypothetical protein CMH31_00610 [Micavibrio sp.]|nr:hypothetical protein [Micavibrio sp.]